MRINIDRRKLHTQLLLWLAIFMAMAGVYCYSFSRFSREDFAMMEEIEAEEKEQKRYDQPNEALEYFLSKRLPAGVTEFPIEKYLEAAEQLRSFPQYSTRRSSGPDDGALLTDGSALETWTPLGPGNIGGRTRALIVNPLNPDIMYAGAASGGVWKTTNGGKDWKPLTDLLPSLAVNTLAFDSQNPEIVYAGTGEGFFNYNAIRGAGIYRSWDGGKSWSRLEGTTGPDFYFVNDLVVSPVNRNRLYAATRSGIMRSLNAGVTWTKVLDAKAGGCLDLVMRTDRNTDYLFATCGTEVGAPVPSSVQASIYRNTDASNGFSAWVEVYSEPGMGRTSLSLAPSNQNVIYAASSESGASGPTHSLHAVFRSNSGGDPGSWSVRVNGINRKKLNTILFTNPLFSFLNECGRGGSQFFHQGWYDNVIAVDPKDENIVWVGGVDLFRSDDGGVNWGMASFWHISKTNPRYVHADHHAIVFHPDFNGGTNQVMLVGTDGGIFRSDNARAQTAAGDRAPCSPETSKISWAPINNNYAVTQFYHGAVTADGTGYLGGTQDNGVILGSDPAGTNGWREVLTGDGGYAAIAPDRPNVMYAMTSGLSLSKSVDGGQKFNPATTGIINSGFKFIVPLVMDPSNSDRLWLGGRALWRTRNGALFWSQASPEFSSSVTAIAVAPTDANFVAAGTETGTIYLNSVGLNSDAGSAWAPTRPRSGYVSSVAFDPTNRDVIYATYSTFDGEHVWRSVDGGTYWQSIDGAGANALPNLPINSLVVDPTNPARLYLGTDAGVFVSTDGGLNWAIELTGFANAPVESLTLGRYAGRAYLFAFTHGRGVWRVPLGNACTSALSSSNQIFGIEGGKGSVSVNASQQVCPWTAESNTNWITITGSQSGAGSGTLTYNVAPSSEMRQRSGTINIGGRSLSVTQAGLAVSVSAASMAGTTIAPESLVAVFGANLASTTQIASGPNLPLVLGNTTVLVKDSKGVERPAPLFFVSPTQINYLMPAETAEGTASVMIFNENGEVFNGLTPITRVAPGLFTANASGQGIAVGETVRVRADSSQIYESIALWDTDRLRFVGRPIDLGPPTDQVYLVLYGTGMRFRENLGKVTVTIGGVPATVTYLGPQNTFAGLDQLNLLLPRSLAGRGEVDVQLTVEGVPANLIRILVK